MTYRHSILPAIEFLQNMKNDLTDWDQSHLIRQWIKNNTPLLQKLNELYFDCNALSELPKEIQYLTGLKSLDLSFQRLSELPKEIVALIHLEQLILRVNFFQLFPLEICQLPQLKRLDISRNSLTILPPQIGQLTQLRQLDLSETLIKALPKELDLLTHLQRLVIPYHESIILSNAYDVMFFPLNRISITLRPRIPSHRMTIQIDPWNQRKKEDSKRRSISHLFLSVFPSLKSFFKKKNSNFIKPS